MTSYKKKIGFSLATLALSLGIAFSFHSEKLLPSNTYPDIIAITLPFEINTQPHTADFLSNKKINKYSGEIPENIQKMMNITDFNPEEIEVGIITAKVDTDSVNALGEMIKNNQLTLNDLYEDISPVFGEAVRNNEINWDWNGYTMEYTFYVADGDELFWKTYFSHPLETLFFHEAFIDVRFVQKDILTNITQNRTSGKNIIHDEENEEKYNLLNKTEKFISLSQKTTNFYTDKLLDIFEKYNNTLFREDNLQIQISSILGINGKTNVNIKNNFSENATDIKINLDGNVSNEEISAQANIRKIKNDIFAILNTYEYNNTRENDKFANLKHITHQWYQLNNPDISEILILLLNEKIQADILTIGKDVLILAKDIILTTDIFIVDEYLGVNKESGYEEFSVKFNEEYTPFLQQIFSTHEFEDIKKFLIKPVFIISFDANNAEYFIIEINKYKISYTKNGLDIELNSQSYPMGIDVPQNKIYDNSLKFHIDKNNITLTDYSFEKKRQILEINIDTQKISGFINTSDNEIYTIDFTKNTETQAWSGEITYNKSEEKITITDFIFGKQTFSGTIQVVQSENILGEITLDFKNSYPKNIEIKNPAENEENTIKSFKELDYDVNYKKYDTSHENPENITLPKNPENYAGSFHKGNYVWGGAMNLAWTDLSKNIIQEEITLDLDTSDTEAQSTVNKLNNPVLTTEDLSEKNYYIKSGYGQKTVDAINKESKEKFPSKSFDDLKIKLSPKDIIAYAYFLKEIEYTIPFTISKYPFFFKDERHGVKSFYAENKEQKENVNILHYENDEKFMVSLSLKDKTDNLILAKGYDMNTPEEVVKHMQNILQNQETFETLQEDDSFQMPFLHVDMGRIYTELMNKFFTNTNFKTYFIAQMFENIKFDMNEKGARVENEAVIISVESIATFEEDKYIPKRIILDDDFWVIMKQNNSLNPYFLLGVQNTEIMKPFEEK